MCSVYLSGLMLAMTGDLGLIVLSSAALVLLQLIGS
jgi:hypothetical protein